MNVMHNITWSMWCLCDLSDPLLCLSLWSAWSDCCPPGESPGVGCPDFADNTPNPSETRTNARWSFCDQYVLEQGVAFVLVLV